MWGLYDMPGNVYEWCWDRYNGDYTTSFQTRTNSAATGDQDPAGADSGDFRVTRGGCCFDGGQYLRSAYRGSYIPYDRSYILSGGFRLVRP